MDIEKLVLRKYNELFEKYGLESVPKSSWKDLCMIELRLYTDIQPMHDPQGRLSNPLGVM